MLFVVIAAAIASWLVVAVFVVLGISVAAVLAYRRLRYVKDNPQTELRRGNSFLSRGPSEPELRHKNFWDLS
jgi:membrane protein implicated in regulation of membrane protease activity